MFKFLFKPIGHCMICDKLCFLEVMGRKIGSYEMKYERRFCKKCCDETLENDRIYEETIKKCEESENIKSLRTLMPTFSDSKRRVGYKGGLNGNIAYSNTVADDISVFMTVDDMLTVSPSHNTYQDSSTSDDFFQGGSSGGGGVTGSFESDSYSSKSSSNDYSSSNDNESSSSSDYSDSSCDCGSCGGD